MFNLTIATSKEIIFEGDAQILNVYTLNGQIGVLPNHSPFVDIIRPCEMRFTDEKGEVHTMAVSGGWLFVWTKEVTVFVNSSEYDYEIDLTKAEEERSIAEQQLESADELDVIQMAHTRATLEKAINRIRVASNKTRN
ncbi:ATP synthase F1 subunit epsilon [Erysipelotrichaceae bacterium OttesenSCG-928-M19]|nr:ATP synthase F1 subunit epsilon [Erysipelotrichaceae bacterium OttesenSCG-928-M19]